MKTLLLLILCTGNLVAQNFTNGSVYNYSVGDTIVTRSALYFGQGTPAQPSTYHYRIFKGKHFSANLDTVFYDVFDYHYTPVSCMTCVASSNSSNSTFFVTDLNQSAVNYTLQHMDACQTMKDTNYVNICGFNEFKKQAVWNSCLEPPVIWDLLIEGVGKLPNYICWNCASTGVGFENTLVAVHKVGGLKCGKTSFVVTGLKEDALKQTVAVFPNPGNGDLIFNCAREGTLQITNSLGSLIGKTECKPGQNAIDITGSAPGVYYLIYHTDAGNLSGKYIKK